MYRVEMDIGVGESEEPEQELFDCLICSQCTPSTNERLVGLVALLQPSNGIILYFLHSGSCQQGRVGSKALHQQNPPVLNCRCQLTQVDLYTTTTTTTV